MPSFVSKTTGVLPDWRVKPGKAKDLVPDRSRGCLIDLTAQRTDNKPRGCSDQRAEHSLEPELCLCLLNSHQLKVVSGITSSEDQVHSLANSQQDEAQHQSCDKQLKQQLC